MRKRRNKTKFRALLKYLPSHAFQNSRSQLMESYTHRTTCFFQVTSLEKKTNGCHFHGKESDCSWKVEFLHWAQSTVADVIHTQASVSFLFQSHGNNLTHDTKLLSSGWRLHMVSKKVSGLFKTAENERWILCNTHHTQSLIFLLVSLPIPLPQMKLILRLEIKRKTSRTCNVGDNTDLLQEQTLPWQPVVSGVTVWCSGKEISQTWPSGVTLTPSAAVTTARKPDAHIKTGHHQLQGTQVASLMFRHQGRGQAHGKKARCPAGPLWVTPAASASYCPLRVPTLAATMSNCGMKCCQFNRGKQFTRFQVLFTISSSTHKGPMHRI